MRLFNYYLAKQTWVMWYGSLDLRDQSSVDTICWFQDPTDLPIQSRVPRRYWGLVLFLWAFEIYNIKASDYLFSFIKVDSKTSHTFKTKCILNLTFLDGSEVYFQLFLLHCVLDILTFRILFDYKLITLFSKESIIYFSVAVNEMLHFQDRFIDNWLTFNF